MPLVLEEEQLAACLQRIRVARVEHKRARGERESAVHNAREQRRIAFRRLRPCERELRAHRRHFGRLLVESFRAREERIRLRECRLRRGVGTRRHE